MRLIKHRRNTIEQLKETPTKYGIEVDIRSFGEKLIINHDPFAKANFLKIGFPSTSTKLLF